MSGVETDLQRPKPSRARRPKRRWILPALALLVLLGIAAVVVIRTHLEEWVWRAVEHRLEDGLGLRVEIGELRVRLFDLSVEFTDLHLRGGPDSPGTLDLRVAYGRARLPWQALLGVGRRKIHLAELRVVRPAVVTDEELFRGKPEREAEGRPLELDLFVKRLEVVSGSWTHEGTERELELTAEELDVLGNWAGEERTMLGDLGVRVGIRGKPFAHRLLVDLRSGFRWQGSTLDFTSGRAVAAGIDVDFAGRLALGEPLSLEIDGELRGDLDRLSSLMEAGVPPLSGEAEGTFQVRLGPQPLQVSGDVQVVEPRVDRFTGKVALAHVEYVPGQLEFSRIEASGFGGKATGEVGVSLGAPAGLRIDLDARGIDTPAFFDWLGIPLPLSAEADGRLQLQGRAGEPASWEGGADFLARARAAAADLVPVDAQGTVEFSAGEVRVRVERAVAGATSLSTEFVADLTRRPARGHIAIEGATADARQTQRVTARVLERLGIALPEFVSRPLHGTGRFRARSALGGGPDLDLLLDLDEGSFATQPFDRLQLDLGLRNNELTVRSLEIHDGERAAVGSARLLQEPLRLLETDFQVLNLDVAALLPLLRLETDLQGRLSGSLRAALGPEGLGGEGALRLDRGSWSGEPFEQVAATIRVERDRFSLQGLTIDSRALTARGAAVLDQLAPSAELSIEEAVLDVGLLESVGDFGLLLRFDGDLRLEPGRVLGALVVEGGRGRVGELAFGGFTGQLDFSESGVVARAQGEGEAIWELDGTLGWEEPLPLHAELRFRDAIFDIPVEHESAVWTRLNGTVTVDGPLRQPAAWQLQGDLSGAELHLGAHRLDLEQGASFTLVERVLETGPLRFVGADVDLALSARWDLDARTIDGSADGQLGLKLLSALLPEVRAAGSATVDVAVTGPVDAPNVSGFLRVEGGRLRHLGFPHTFEQIAMDVSLQRDEARIDKLSALVGGGEIAGTGRVGIGAGGIEDLHLDWSGTNVRIALPEGFEGVYQGQLALSGTPDRMVLSGEVNMLRGIYTKPLKFGSLFRSRTREYSAGARLPANIWLDLIVRADGNVWVRNDLAEVETHVGIKLGGTLQRPEVSGRIGLIEGGKLSFRGVTYNVRSGSLEFTDPEGLNPYVQVTAQTAVSNYQVSLRVEGTLDEMDYELSSNPSLSQQDIIALLTTGKTLSELSAGAEGRDAEFTGDLAASYFAGALTEQFESQLQRALGLDVLQINPLLVETGDPTTRVTVGKKVSDDVLVIISATPRSTEDTLYQIDWQANSKLRVTVQRDTNGGLGSDLLYTDRFWWKKPRGAREEAVPAAIEREQPAVEETKVGVVRIIGVEDEEAQALVRIVPLEAGAAFQRSTVFRGVEAIRRFYVKRNRLRATVESRSTPRDDDARIIDVTYQVDPGPEYRVVFEGLKKKEERRLRSRLEKMWAESLFSEDIYADSVAIIRKDFQSRGFYAVDVSYRRKEADGVQQVDFVIDRGKPVRVRQVEIVGASRIPVERVRKQMLTRPPSLFSDRVFDAAVLQDDLSAIRNLYWDQGFLDVEIEDPRIRLNATGDRVDISLRIDEGPEFIISGIEFSEQAVFDRETLLEWSGLEQGAPFSQTRLLEAESALRRRFDREGYPDARVRGRVTIGEASVAVRMDVEPGPQMRVRAIRITGNELTKPRVIAREMRMRRGDLISREKILQGQHRLYRLSIFRNVRISYQPAEGGQDGEYDLQVHVEEERPLSLITGVGYNTEAGFNFSFATSQDNLGGRARSLGLQGQVSEILERIQFIYQTPRIFGASVPALANLLYERAERDGFTVQRRSTALRVDRRINRRWRGFLRYNYQRVDLLDVTDPDELLEERVEDIVLGDVGVAFFRVTRDSLLLPTKGNYLNFVVSVFAKPLLSDANFVKAQVTESHQWTFRNGTSFVTAFRAGFAPTFGSTEVVPISERFFAGGDSTNRGFARDRLGPTLRDIVPPADVPALQNPDTPVGGQALLLLNQEFRFPIWKQLKGSVFYDAGNVFLSLSDFDPLDLRHTLGAGLRYETPVGPIRAEYGWKLDREPDESAGQFHLAIGVVY